MIYVITSIARDILSIIPPALEPYWPASLDTAIIAINSNSTAATKDKPFLISDLSSCPASLTTPTIISKAIDILRSIEPAFDAFLPASLDTATKAITRYSRTAITAIPLNIVLPSSLAAAFITLVIKYKAIDILRIITAALSILLPVSALTTLPRLQTIRTMPPIADTR